jgi:putative ABC transport system ATP-binding protein
MTMNTLLETKGLNKHYLLGKGNEHPVLRDVNLTIRRGEFVSVMGPSGSGKTTLLYTISGMDRMSSGSVQFNGRELSKLSEEELSSLRLLEMGFVFQHIHLLKNLSIFDNIILSGYLAKSRSRGRVNRRATELMRKTGIHQLAKNDVNEASGGQLQRVGICRALINEPHIVFGDEPTGALNSAASDEILDLLSEINSGGTTIMLVTHDVKVAARSERVLCMIDGQITAEKQLGAYSGGSGEAKSREELLSSWLIEMGV